MNFNIVLFVDSLLLEREFSDKMIRKIKNYCRKNVHIPVCTV